MIETAVANSVSEAAKISRNIQQALYQDAEAFFAGIDKLASAKSLNEAVRSSPIWYARGAKCWCRGRSRQPNISASLSRTAPRPAEDNFTRSIPEPPDPDSPFGCVLALHSEARSMPAFFEPADHRCRFVVVRKRTRAVSSHEL